MLVLSRKLHERILIGPDVVITLCGLQPTQAQIGIEAPKHVRIVREEIAEQDELRRLCTSALGDTDR